MAISKIVLLRWAACEGDCVSIGFNTTYRNQSHAANFFTCDPASVCYQLGTRTNILLVCS